MDASASPALLVFRVVQSRQASSEQQAQILVMKKAMNLQESVSATLLNSVAGNLPLASSGSLGTQLNTMV